MNHGLTRTKLTFHGRVVYIMEVSVQKRFECTLSCF